MAAPASCSVAGKRWPMRVKVGCCWRSEVPKSPRTAFNTKSPYWTYHGRSKPMRWRNSSICCVFQLSLTMSMVGSPLRNSVPNESIDTPNRTKTVCSNRRTR